MMFAHGGMRHLFKNTLHMKFFILFSFCILLLNFGCKSKPLDKNHISFPIEDTLFKNKESEYHTIDTKLHSLYQDRTTLVIYNGKKISLKKLNLLKRKIDSTFIIRIFKDKTKLNKMKVNEKYRTLILIHKSS